MSVLEPLYAPFASSAAVLLWPALFLLLSRQLRRRAWFWPYVALSLPGTVLHELCHFLVGWLLRARPSRFSVWPRRNGRQLTLGQVGFSRLTWWNALPIGIAPLLLLPLGWGLLALAARGPWLSPAAAGLGFLAAQCWDGCLPSSTDLSHAGRSALAYGALLNALFGAYALLHYGFRALAGQ